MLAMPQCLSVPRLLAGEAPDCTHSRKAVPEFLDLLVLGRYMAPVRCRPLDYMTSLDGVVGVVMCRDDLPTTHGILNLTV